MDPLMMALVGLGIGAGKSAFIDAPRERRQRELAAVKWRTSPWTGVVPGDVAETDYFGNSLGGALQGASLGQGINAQNMDAALKAKQLASMSGGIEPTKTTPAPAFQDTSSLLSSPMTQTNYQAALTKNPWGFRSTGAGSNFFV